MRALAAVLLLFPAVLPLFGQTTDSKADPKQPTPKVFQSDEGDHWMLLGDKPLIFKVDPVSTGSDTLVVGTEEMPTGNRIPTHVHADRHPAHQQTVAQPGTGSAVSRSRASARTLG